MLFEAVLVCTKYCGLQAQQRPAHTASMQTSLCHTDSVTCQGQQHQLLQVA
jgi:hypothetical protein